MYIQPQTYHELTNMMETGILRPIYRSEDTPEDVETIGQDIHGEIIGYEYRPSRQWQKDIDKILDFKYDLDIYPYLQAYIATVYEEGLGPYGWIF